MKNLVKGLLLSLVLVLFMSQGVLAQDTFTSNGTGTDYNTAANWTKTGSSGTSTYPGENNTGDIIVINTGHTRTLDANVPFNVASITLNGTGQLQLVSFDITSDGDVTGAGTITVSTGTLDVDGNLGTSTTALATLTCSGASAINVAGDWYVTSFTRSTSTVTFDGSSAQSVGTNNFYNNFTVTKGGGTLTANSNFTVVTQFSLTSGTVEVPSGIEIDLYGSGTIFSRTGGNFSTNSSGQFTFSNNTSTLSTNAAINFPGIKFKNYDGVVPKTLTFSGGQFTVYGDVERGGNHSLALSSATLVYSAGRTLTYSASGSVMTVGVEWPGTNSPYNVTNISSQNVTLNASRTITSGGTISLQQTGGNFIVGSSYTLTVNGTLERKTSGTSGILADGSTYGTVSYATTGSHLIYNAGAATTIGNEWPSSNSPENVVMTLTNDAALSSVGALNRTIIEDLTMNVGTLNLGSGTLTVAGSVTGSEIAGSATINDNTILYLGDGGSGSSETQIISGSLTLNKLTIYKTTGTSDLVQMTGSSSLTFTSGGTITITDGVFDLNGASRLVDRGNISLTVSANGTLNTGGTPLNDLGSLTATSGTIVFDGSARENLPGGETISTVTINNSGGAITTGTLQIGTLNLTSGRLTSSSSNYIHVTSSISGSASGYIYGPLRRTLTASTDYSFPVGKTAYRPAIFNWTNGSPGTDVVEIEYFSSAPGGTAPSGISSISTQGYYKCARISGSTTGGFDITLDLTDSNFNPFNRNKILVQNGSGPVYDFPDNDTYSDPNVTATTDGFPTNDFILAFGEGGTTVTWAGGATGIWNSASNWSGSSVPTSEDDVTIDLSGGVTVTIGSSTAAVCQSLIIGNGADSDVTLVISSTNNPPLSVTNALTVNSEGQITFNASNAFNAGTTTFNTGSIVEYQQGNIPADSYAGLVINGASGTSGASTATESLAKQGTSNFTASHTIGISGTGTYTQSGTGNAAYSGTSGLTTGTGTFAISGGTVSNVDINSTTTTVTGGSFSGTITFSGSAQTIGGATAPSFSTLIVNPSTSVTFNNAVTASTEYNQVGGTAAFNGGVTVSGTMDLDGGTVGGSGAVNLNGSNAEIAGGTFSANVIFGGTATQTVSGGVPASFTNLTINKGSSSIVTFDNAVTTSGTFTNTAGVSVFNGGLVVTGSPFLLSSGSVGGSSIITINSATVTDNGGSFIGTVNLNSSNTSVGGTGSPDFVNLTVTNGATFNTGASVSGILTLSSGIVEMQTYVLTLGPLASTSGSPNDTKYVKGAMAKQTATGSFTFPIGDSNYRPFSINSFTGTLPTVQVEVEDSPAGSCQSPLVRVSEVRYFKIDITSGSVTGGNVTLSYGDDDGVSDVSESGDLVVAMSDDNGSSDNYVSIGGPSSGSVPPPLATITSTSGVGSLSNGNDYYFALGTTTGDNSLPVEMTSFDVKAGYGKVSLSWKTASEVNNAGFYVKRSVEENGNFIQLNSKMIDGVEGGNSSVENSYSYVDNTVEEETTYYYKIVSVDMDGTVHENASGIVSVTTKRVPRVFSLNQNYPNPFNPTTFFNFSVPKEGRISLIVYNALGQEVKRVLDSKQLEVGEYKGVYNWDGTNKYGQTVSSGIYFFRLISHNYSYHKTMKMMFLK